jgi:hypothetical protein
VNGLDTVNSNPIAHKYHSLSLKNMTISCYSVVSSVSAMPFSASIARNMLRVCSVNCAACEAALSAAEAIPREIGREVTVMLKEVMIFEKQPYYFRRSSTVEPSKSSRTRRVSDQNSATSVEVFAKRRTSFHQILDHFKK